MGSQKNSAVKLLTSFVAVFLLAHQTQQAPIFECGRSEFRSRMVGGGSEAMANEFPWMAHLLIRRGDGQLFHCGGTLISDSHVLTATHCVVHNETKIHDVLAITLGTNVIAREGSSQDLDWKKIVIPAGVELTGPDIAIVTLSKPVAFTDSVRPACLPFANDTDHVNDPVVLTGWGEYNSSGSVMRKIQASVLPGGQCRETASRAVLSDGFLICTEHRPGQHCNGDDGGPMNYYNAELDRWFVLGVAGRGDCRGKSSVFTRVRSRLDFIRDYSGVVPIVTKSNTTDPTPEEITTTTTSPFTCAGKKNGNYPNPASNCSANFYTCSNGYASLSACSSVLIYHAELDVCDWHFNVAGCY